MNDRIGKIGMKTPHVGAFVRDAVLDELNLSVTEAAEILGVRRATLSDFINEKASLSPEMALRIEKAFGVKMNLLLQIQAGYDIERMRSIADTINVRRYVPKKKKEPA
jgi:addiction module HigA family antidote